jgi:plasmid replication initiation protein
MSLLQQTIRKSNALVEASYRLTVFEQRIILSCLSQIGKYEDVTDNVLYKVSAVEMANSVGITRQTAYQRLKEASERLFDRRVTLVMQSNGGGPMKPLQTRWVQSVRYSDAHVEVRFAKDILPYLTELHEQFTRFKFGDIAKMSSAYAVRLYEMLMQWQETTQRREVEIEWLKQILQVEDKYPAVKDFKKWVLEPALKQIDEHSPITVKWEQRKTGRSVTHITLSYVFKKPETKPAKAVVEKKAHDRLLFGYPESVLSNHAHPGETYQQVARRLKVGGL